MDNENFPSDDVQVVERVIIYDPETGEIVGSNIFGVTGKPSDAARRRFESLLQRDVAE
jgi:hypothetical protein